MVLKILHTADWHLGKRFRSFPEADETRLTRARLEVLDLIFGLAAQHSVDAVLCAGDLFDDPFPLEEWWQPVARVVRQARMDHSASVPVAGESRPPPARISLGTRACVPPGLTMVGPCRGQRPLRS